MARSRLHQLLEIPAVYRLAQSILAPGNAEIDRAYDELFGDSRGRVLDVGAGPRADTPLPQGLLVGLDVNRHYVAQYRRALPGERHDCHKLGTVASAAAMPFRDATFDESRCAAVLHHLPDDLARTAVAEMVRVVRPGGRVVLFDTVRPPRFARAPAAWLIARFDRGEFVRTADELESLVRATVARPWHRSDLVYSWYRLHGLVLTLEKR